MKSIALISQDLVLTSIISRIVSDRCHVVVFGSMQSAMDHIYNEIPNLLIIDMVGGDPVTIQILNNLKQDPMFNQLPVLAILDDGFEIAGWELLFVEDYIRKSDLGKEAGQRIDLCILRSERVVEVNPLTRLPGNISINRQIQSRIDRGAVFALAYADLDHFKPFNDNYGFSRGDEIIKMTGRLLLNMVRNGQLHDSFIGHIGGDDFVYIMESSLMEEATREIIEAFDRIIPTFYDSRDRARGAIESTDRQGVFRSFPLMTISIGMIDNEFKSFSHYGEMTEGASEMKKHAKRFRGSCYRLNRRQPSI